MAERNMNKIVTCTATTLLYDKDLPQGLLFCTGETVKAPIELLRCWLHETQRVYGDRLLEEKDLEMLTKLQVDVTKKIFEVSVLERRATKRECVRG